MVFDKMTCYSARYLGDKINTYHSHEYYLLQKLTRKIERKYELTSLGDLAPIVARGYYTTNGDIVRWSSWYGKWTIIGELYECPHFYDEIITYSDCPCVYFDFRYYPNNSEIKVDAGTVTICYYFIIEMRTFI